MEVSPQAETQILRTEPRAQLLLLFPTFLVVVCLLGLMAIAKGSSFVPRPKHSPQYAETLTKKHVMHSPTMILREPLPLVGRNAPIPLVAFVARIGHIQLRVSPAAGVNASIRDRSPPSFLS
ncbi:MAG: hypothetical protein WA871_03840 [Candidatus Acidiferrales bacterium]